ncbi:hypothetical protein AVANS_0698 [Campylobacter sp. RM5004]|uniref:hypothetical protein n=1 Tax=Campylobacter sp. RM5004 TaxID=1660078 RepID=UPI001EFBC269|nr:hypothetical protein [Campylobacter sp. RM5004]ULO01328.1 hypothetical protein AVANS_0698 [Campylobacter sp. RM5004]
MCHSNIKELIIFCLEISIRELFIKRFGLARYNENLGTSYTTSSLNKLRNNELKILKGLR